MSGEEALLSTNQVLQPVGPREAEPLLTCAAVVTKQIFSDAGTSAFYQTTEELSGSATLPEEPSCNVPVMQEADQNAAADEESTESPAVVQEAKAVVKALDKPVVEPVVLDIPGASQIPSVCVLCMSQVIIAIPRGTTYYTIETPDCLSAGSCEPSWAAMHPEAYKDKNGEPQRGIFPCQGADRKCTVLVQSTDNGVSIIDGACQVDLAGVEYYARGRTKLDNMPLDAPTERIPAFDGERLPDEVDNTDVEDGQEGALSGMVEPKYRPKPRPCRSMRKAVSSERLWPEFGARRAQALGICVKPLSEMRTNIGWQP